MELRVCDPNNMSAQTLTSPLHERMHNATSRPCFGTAIDSMLSWWRVWSLTCTLESSSGRVGRLLVETQSYKIRKHFRSDKRTHIYQSFRFQHASHAQGTDSFSTHIHPHDHTHVHTPERVFSHLSLLAFWRSSRRWRGSCSGSDPGRTLTTTPE